MTNDDFDWAGEDVVVRSQLAIAVYPNASGGVTIRQIADWCEEEDAIISLPCVNAVAVAEAILQAAADIEDADAEPADPKPRDATAAERRRKYRERRRNSVTRDGVTESVTRDVTDQRHDTATSRSVAN